MLDPYISAHKKCPATSGVISYSNSSYTNIKHVKADTSLIHYLMNTILTKYTLSGHRDYYYFLVSNFKGTLQGLKGHDPKIGFQAVWLDTMRRPSALACTIHWHSNSSAHKAEAWWSCASLLPACGAKSGGKFQQSRKQCTACGLSTLLNQVYHRLCPSLFVIQGHCSPADLHNAQI